MSISNISFLEIIKSIVLDAINKKQIVKITNAENQTEVTGATKIPTIAPIKHPAAIEVNELIVLSVP